MKTQRKPNRVSTNQLFGLFLLTLIFASFIVFVAISHEYSAISFSLGGDWLKIQMSQQ